MSSVIREVRINITVYTTSYLLTQQNGTGKCRHIQGKLIYLPPAACETSSGSVFVLTRAVTTNAEPRTHQHHSQYIYTMHVPTTNCCCMQQLE